MDKGVKIVKVFTKYDQIEESIFMPVVRKLTHKELKHITASVDGDQSGFLSEKVVKIKKIVYGLEDVKFVTYE